MKSWYGSSAVVCAACFVWSMWNTGVAVALGKPGIACGAFLVAVCGLVFMGVFLHLRESETT